MDAVSYPDARVAQFVTTNFVPLRLPFDSVPYAADFNIKWTPTLITLDPDGKEHHRTVGFLGPDELIPSLLLGIGKSFFESEKFPEAIEALNKLIADHPQSASAPEAMFLLGVAKYKNTHDPMPLRHAYDRLTAEFPGNEWTKRAFPYRLIG